MVDRGWSWRKRLEEQYLVQGRDQRLTVRYRLHNTRERHMEDRDSMVDRDSMEHREDTMQERVTSLEVNTVEEEGRIMTTLVVDLILQSQQDPVRVFPPAIV